MKVFRPGQRGRVFTLHISPGVTDPVTDFLKPDGTPKLFSVEFLDGIADVPDNLGDYLLDNKHAASSPIILPEHI